MPQGVRPAALTSKFDWREQEVVTRVQDQGACGSCYAFAFLASFESMLQIDGVGTYDFSENNAKECPWHDPSCGGGNAWEMAGWLSEKGTVQESCDPYVANDVSCKTTCPYIKTLLNWRYISQDTPDTEVLKGYIQTYGPVYVSIYAGDDSDPLWRQEFSDYDGSYTLYYDGTVDRTNHGVLIVGWDDSLTHAGGTGGWIVKNSWGTDWGGTCGYGAEGGYFTIGYGSRTFGRSSSFVYDWQDYDPDGGILYYNEVGMTNAVGYGATTAWGLSKFIPSRDTYVDRVEFYTLDETTDVDVYLYDDFDGTTLDNLLWSSLDHSFDEAGYHGVAVAPPLTMTDSDDIVAVVRFTNTSYEFPIAVDDEGPHETQRTYTSPDGSTWYDEGDYGDDVTIRLRTSEEVGNAPPNRPSNPSPTNGATGVSANADLSWSGGDPDTGDTVTYDVYLEADDSTPGVLVCDDANDTSCDPGTLDANTHYYWYVEATDSHDATTTGDTWEFTTGEEIECSILFDASHDTEDFDTIDDNYADFADEVRAMGYGMDELQTGPLTPAALSGYCALVLADPEIAFTEDEVQAVHDFVEAGGGLFVLGEGGDKPENNNCNPILEPFGMRLDQDYIYDGTDNYLGISFCPLIHEFADHPVTAGLTELWYAVGASIDVDAPAEKLGWGDGDSYTRGGHTLASSWATSTPVIDGRISAGEWSEATRVDLRASAEASTVMMYLKNDGEKLYLAFDDPNDTTFSPGNYDQILIQFDDEPTGARDGAWTYDACPSGEGGLFVGEFTPYPSTAFRGIASGPEECDLVEPAAGVNGGTSAASGHVQHEVAIDLSASELRGSPGDEIGMGFYVSDYDTESLNGFWTWDAAWDDPSTYGDVRLAAPGDVGRPVAIAASQYGSGRVVALGDSAVVRSYDGDEDGTPDIYQYDGERFAKNVVNWICRCGEAPNTPPDTPNNPSPADGATDVSTEADLSWTGGDADPGDTVTYDVYFEAEESAPDELECDDVPEPFCDPGTLSDDTEYYWYVVASDDKGGITTGDTWHFTTGPRPNSPPDEPSNPTPADGATDQDLDVNLSWIGGDPDGGDDVTYDVYFRAGGSLVETRSLQEDDDVAPFSPTRSGIRPSLLWGPSDGEPEVRYPQPVVSNAPEKGCRGRVEPAAVAVADALWRTRASMPTARSPGVAEATNGKIYAIGGYDGSDYLSTVEEYDPATDTWTIRASMPTARSGIGVAAASNGKVYAIGGYDGSDYLAMVEAYDPATDSWTTRASMPTARSGAAVVAASNGRIYAIGGTGDGGRVAAVEAYDPASDTWATRASMPAPRSGLGAADSDGKIYAIGGSDGNAITRVEVYDPAADSWATRTDMPTARDDLGVAMVSGKIYAVGGTSVVGGGPVVHDTVEAYDPGTDTWTTQTSLPSGRESPAVVGASNGKLYVVGGVVGRFSMNPSYRRTLYEGTPPHELICDGVPDSQCDPGTLEPGRHYYWYVVATDSHGASTEGEIWHFTTEAEAGGPVYLPLVMRRYPPLPDVPVLNAISNPEGDGNYTVSWGEAYLADEYVLQEDDNQGFSSPTERYSGSGLSWDASGKAPGTYYYRVKAINWWSGKQLDSSWSNTRSVTVRPPGVHYEGDSPWVSFDVVGQQVCDFEMEVPFDGGTCHVDLPDCLDIVGGEFSYTALDPWFKSYENTITGRFKDQNRVEGDYSLYFCGNTFSFEPNEGDWDASKQ